MLQLLKVDENLTDIKEMLLFNARTLMENGMDEQGLIGANWNKRPTMPIELCTQLSGVMLLEASVNILCKG